MHQQVRSKKILVQIQALQSRVNDRLKTTENWYKQNYDARVRRFQTFTPGQLIFMDRPSLKTTPSGKAEQLPQSSYTKLVPRTPGPFRVVRVTLLTLNIDEDETHNTMTVDQASTAPNQSHNDNSTQSNTAENSLATSLRENDCSHLQSPNEYAVSHIVV